MVLAGYNVDLPKLEIKDRYGGVLVGTVHMPGPKKYWATYVCQLQLFFGVLGWVVVPVLKNQEGSLYQQRRDRDTFSKYQYALTHIRRYHEEMEGA